MSTDPGGGARGSGLRKFLDDLNLRMKPVARPMPLPGRSLEELRAVSAAADLAECFTAAAEAAGCQVHRVAVGMAAGATCEILRRHGARCVLVERQPGSFVTDQWAAELRQALEGAGIAVTDRHDDETVFSVDAAVTGVVAGIAETGTIVCASGPCTARGTTLIPPMHVAVVSEDQLVGDLFDYFDELGSRTALPANLNLITGPSKTADIEGILITGVHGPGVVHIVLIGPGVELLG